MKKIFDDSTVCHVCGMRAVHTHHIYFGSGNRKLSTKYGMTVPLCYEHHEGDSGVHFNRELDLKLKREGQEWFNANYPELDFMEIFGRNYIW